MDKDHRLDAPDNESLKTIEQLGNHPELSTIYPKAKKQWAGELLSEDERETKRGNELRHINVTIRKWFPVIGLLTPLPFVLGSILLAGALTFLKPNNLALLLLPVSVMIVIWLYVSYHSVKRVYRIFYDHSIKATPFVITLLGLLALSLQGHYVALVPIYTDSVFYNALITSSVILAMSVLISGLLIFIWTTLRISSTMKFVSIGIIAVAILIATVYVNFL